jgi:excisionase family DNA binding protein
MQVLNYDEAARRASFTRRTLERLIDSGEGPATVRLSKRRVGIAEDDLNEWLLARRRPAPGLINAA